MPTAPATPESSPRPRVTDKHLFPDVGSFGVRRVGRIVVLEFGTPQGEFIFHVRERSFIKRARRHSDDCGNPFRTIDEIDAANQAEIRRDTAAAHNLSEAAALGLPLEKPAGGII